MNILITGGTGFIGRALCQALKDDGHKLYVFTRYPERHQGGLSVSYISDLSQLHHALQIDAVINLAGEPLNAGRWNARRKQMFIDSRVLITQHLVEWMGTRLQPPAVFISGSAIGWYGEHQDQVLDESADYSSGFTHDLCQQWETAALAAESLNVRVCLLRIGIVLEQEGGPLQAMLLPFKLGGGGPMGNGQQYWSWIHRLDLIRIIQRCLSQTGLHGPVNATAPEAVPQKVFAKALGHALKRPAFFPMPSLVATLMMGEFAQEVLLKGQRVYPQKLLEDGFTFQYPALAQALASMDL